MSACNIRNCYQALFAGQGSHCLTQCIESADERSRVVIEEKGKKYKINNKTGKLVVVYQVDGKMMNSSIENKCDYLLLIRETQTAIFVELKGNHIDHALVQIGATVEKLKNDLGRFVLCGRIIATKGLPNMKATPEYIKLSKFFRLTGGTLELKGRKLCEDI